MYAASSTRWCQAASSHMLAKGNGHREERHDVAIASVRKRRGKPCDRSPKIIHAESYSA